MKTTLSIAQGTDVGGRPPNEDAYGTLALDTGVLLLVADGLGGHQGGELASACFVEGLIEMARRAEHELDLDPSATCRRLIEEAGRRMAARLTDGDPELTAHTTCVMAWVTDQGVTVAHVGDSRLYRLGNTGVQWRSRDHSIVQLLIDQEEIDEHERNSNPDQARLYKSISGRKPANPSMKQLPPLELGEALLLCSDGFWAQVEDTEMVALTRTTKLQGALDALIRQAVSRAGSNSDNTTAVIAVAG